MSPILRPFYAALYIFMRYGHARVNKGQRIGDRLNFPGSGVVFAGPHSIKAFCIGDWVLAAGLSQDGHLAKCDSSGKRSSFNIFRGKLPHFFIHFLPLHAIF